MVRSTRACGGHTRYACASHRRLGTHTRPRAYVSADRRMQVPRALRHGYEPRPARSDELRLAAKRRARHARRERQRRSRGARAAFACECTRSLAGAARTRRAALTLAHALARRAQTIAARRLVGRIEQVTARARARSHAHLNIASSSQRVCLPHSAHVARRAISAERDAIGAHAICARDNTRTRPK